MEGKKKKEKDYTGFMGDLSEGQQAMLDYFRNWIKTENISDHPQYDDYYMLRFLRARQFDWDKTKLMFTNFLNWRKEKNVDNILKTFTFDEASAVKDVYPHGYHNLDRLGRPIYIERLGNLKLETLMGAITEERLQLHYIFEYENLLKLRFPVCSELAGRRVEQGLTILDLHGFTMG